MLADAHQALRPDVKTPYVPPPPQQVMDKARHVAKTVNERWRMRTKMVPSLLFNKSEATAQVADLFLDEFRTWDRDELLFLVAVLHTQIVLEQM